MAPVKKVPTRNPNVINVAVEAVQKGELSIRKSSQKYGIPFETLRTHVNGERMTTILGRPPALPKPVEEDLKIALNEMLQMGHGVGTKDLRELGRNIADLDNKRFKNETPSLGWARCFVSRHGLTLRRPENVSAARMENEKLEIIAEFYTKLREIYNKLEPKGLTSCEIYNTDETGLCVVNKSGKVIATKGEKMVRSRKGGERGENVTVIATANASGTVIIPPTIIFKGKTLNADLMNGAMDGAVFAHSKSSFIDTEIFSNWFDRFIEMIPPKRPVLLFMDGHASHISLEVIQKALENGIHILLFPAHLTHLMQPMDLSVFGPLKKRFSHGCDTLARKNKIKALNRYHFCQVLTPAWFQAVTPENIRNGFAKAGIWPFNPSKVLERFNRAVENQLPATNNGSENNVLPTGAPRENASPETTFSETAVQGSAIPVTTRLGEPERSEDLAGADRVVSETAAEKNIQAPVRQVLGQIQPVAAPSSPASPVVAVIREFLKPAELETPQRMRKVTTAMLITSTEFAKAIEEKENLKKQKEEEKMRRQEERKRKKIQMTEQAKRRKELTKDKTKVCFPMLKVPRKNRLPSSSSSSSEGNDDPDSDSDVPFEDETLCGTCGKSFFKDFKGEAWIRCKECAEWYHNSCQGLREDEFSVKFKCDDCCPLNDIRNRKK